MGIETRTLIEQVRALPPEDRIALVEDMLDSLDHADLTIDRLWAREAADRVAACRRGELAARELRACEFFDSRRIEAIRLHTHLTLRGCERIQGIRFHAIIELKYTLQLSRSFSNAGPIESKMSFPYRISANAE